MACSGSSSMATVLFVLFSASSSSLPVLQAARILVPVDDRDAHVVSMGAADPTASAAVVGAGRPSSRESLPLMAPPLPPAAQAGKPEMVTAPPAVGKRWGEAQLQGSVPSPGIGH
uniref:Uncharacterized protein n=1 Tax=Oryza brachyantha TaxID=4533 RepID=J3M4V3_ORYBR